MTDVQPIPPGYHTVTPYLIVNNAAEAIDFYSRAFGATEKLRMPGPGGFIMHAEIQIGDSVVMLSDEHPDVGAFSPETVGGNPVSMMIYSEDVDAAFARAIEAGAQEVMPIEDMFWGDRYGRLADPYGHVWGIATHIEDVGPEELEARLAAMMG